MAYYKITDTELKEVTKLLDRLLKIRLSGIESMSDYNVIRRAKEMSQHIKDNYTKIK